MLARQRQLGLAALLALLHAALPALSQQAFFRSYSVREGLSQSQVFAIVQDDAGYLWLGTGFGLDRFDGQSFRTITSAEGLASGVITALAIDAAGRVWAGHQRGRVSVQTGPETFEAFDLAGPARGGDILRLVLGPRGRLWAFTGERLLRFDPADPTGSVVSVELPDGEGVRAVAVDDRRVCIASDRRLYALVEDAADAPPVVRMLGEIPDGPISALGFDLQRRLWVGTVSGALFVHRLVRGGTRADLVRVFGRREGLPPAPVTRIAVGLAGETWLGTAGRGVVRLEWNGRGEPVVRRFTTRNGLGHDQVVEILLDREGDVWFGTDGGGVSAYLGGRFETFLRQGSPGERTIWSIARTADGAYWFGTDEGLVRMLHEDGENAPQTLRLGAPFGLCGRAIRDLAVGPDGRLWIAAEQGAICRLDPGTLAIDHVEIEVARRADFFDIAWDRAGALWIGTSRGVLRFVPDPAPPGRPIRGALETVPLPEVSGGEPPRVYVVFVDREGTVWAGADGLGLVRLAPRSAGAPPRVFGREEGLGHLGIGDMCEDPSGTLWIGADDGGFYRFDGQRFTYVPAADDPVRRENVYLVACDPSGDVFLGTNRGLHRYEPDRRRWRRYGLAEGFVSLETNVHARMIDRDGRHWFGTIDGAVRYDGRFDRPRTVPPTIHVVSVGRPLEGSLLARGARIPWRRSPLEFRFVGISLAAPEKVRYRYRLAGLDDDWIGPTEESVASFVALPPGDYVFEVMAANADGFWSAEPARFAFTVAAPFWRTGWFAALTALAAVAALVLVVRWRLGAVTRANRRLEQSVRERTIELSQRTLELERANEALQQAVARAEDATRAKSAFLATMSHEIRTPMNGVLGTAELLRNTRLDEDQRQLVGTIWESGRELLNLLNDILDLSRIEAGRIEISEERFEPARIAEKVAALFAGQARRKGLELFCVITRDVPMYAQGDAHRIQQILTNLVGNAIKFTREGRVVIVLDARPAEGHEARVVLEYRVEDTGIGVSPDQLERIFEPFSQVDSSFARRHTGTGLGLAICRQLARQMGGDITVESRLDGGSVFTARLVCRDPVPAPSDRPLDGRRFRLMAADSAVWALHARQLEELGARVFGPDAAGDGDQGCDAAIVHVPRVDDPRTWLRSIRGAVPGHVPLVALLAPEEALDDDLAEGLEPFLRLARPVLRSRLVDTLLHVTEQTVPLDPARAERSGPQFALSCLVVDDNEINRKVAMRMLENLGCEVVGAASGEQALARLREGHFDLVFMDCQMPGMDGFECTRAIRNMPEKADLPVIALTANAMKGDRDRCLEAGMNDYLAKPISHRALRAVLERWSVVAVPS
ncbi:MAG: hybrid sensor histidine kinase/response regulator [Acidobacteria bacterium]|nr:MAG: hybrid sensor histidine kinase/response regulator [Acidobacteriota bacterium]